VLLYPGSPKNSFSRENLDITCLFNNLDGLSG
jgi:hypothetical protein